MRPFGHNYVDILGKFTETDGGVNWLVEDVPHYVTRASENHNTRGVRRVGVGLDKATSRKRTAKRKTELELQRTQSDDKAEVGTKWWTRQSDRKISYRSVGLQGTTILNARINQ